MNKNWLPHLRGILVAVHILAVMAGAFPVIVDRRGLDREMWKTPIAQNEIEKVTARLVDLGIETTPADVGEKAWQAASRLVVFQENIQRPFGFYYREMGVRQRWRMFPAPVKERSGVVVEVKTDGKWKTVYEMGDRNHQWLAGHFNRDRFRAALNLYRWEMHPESLGELADWLAVRASDDFPESTALRLRFSVSPCVHPPGVPVPVNQSTAPVVERPVVKPEPVSP